MTSFITLNQAIARHVARSSPRVLTAFQLGVAVFRIVGRGSFEGTPLEPIGEPQRRHYDAALEFLLDYGVLARIKGLRRASAFTLMGPSSVAPAEIACALDPFGYLSHLTAMEHHGLTDRVSRTLYLVSPSTAEWRASARGLMDKALGADVTAYEQAGFPAITRPIGGRLVDRDFVLTHRSQLGAFRLVPDTGIRVATLGRTFLDMLREPNLCGGIHHVLEIYREHATRNVALIVAEVERHGEPIDKVRAGYVLDEVCGLRTPEIDGWLRFAQRGGSRRLVASAEYAPQYSEKWCLSLNA